MKSVVALMLTDGPGEWVRDAACANHNPEHWFPPKGQKTEETRKANQICATCPVLIECLTYSLTSPVMEHGMWAGIGETHRRKLRRHIGLPTQPANPIYPLCGTEAGAKVHERRGEKRCPPCARAALTAKHNRETA